jgi:hypothetical protein
MVLLVDVCLFCWLCWSFCYNIVAVCVSVGLGKGVLTALEWRVGVGRMRGSDRGFGTRGPGGGGGVVLCPCLKCLFNISKMELWKSVCVSFS